MEEKQQERTVQLLFVGSALLDVTSQSGPDLLREYALEQDGCVMATDDRDDLFQKLLDDPRSTLDAGGSALNSAKVAKWVAGSRAKVAFAGCVGNDDYGARLEVELQRLGVEPLLVALPGQCTGVCACLLGPGGQRSLCTRQGASAHFSQHHLDQGSIGKWLTESRVIFLVGYFAACAPSVVTGLATRLMPGQLFGLSLSAEYVCRDFGETLLSVLSKVDIVFGNEAEVRALAPALGLKEPFHVESVASTIAATIGGRSDSPGIVVVTRGPRHVILARGRDQPQYLPVPEVAVVDGVGCGDALAGAFLSVYALTRDASRALEAGIKAASQIAQMPGCNPPTAEKFVY